ncbi:cupredoxin domain-containing protein [Natronomonas salsuginis]|jgi:plastocyanin|uniref:Blue (type 1) copper domain-containing protein n=1 Tax=Natronomonas salsuginis TaxID=2217661 RepID=A0A4U5J7T9_9EURY|nr:plastocyanin/azurin family copper-binding protein [Natronomonas salsuginis]TKR25122.1 hypothetical protein DM868_12285 [Natronomonas salsuginis]
MIRRRRFLTVTAASTVPLVAGCTGANNGGSGRDGATVEETSDVSMTGNQFQPRNIHVDAGTTVTWSNDDDFDHTVTSASENWDKDTNVSGEGQTTHTFENNGVYDVYCTIHGGSDLSGMSMKVGVGDATIESPLGGDSGGSGEDPY